MSNILSSLDFSSLEVFALAVSLFGAICLIFSGIYIFVSATIDFYKSKNSKNT